MIKFYDLQKINAQYADELNAAAQDVISNGWYIQGKHVGLFERNLAEYIGVKHAVGVGNGYDALYLILRAYLEMGVLQAGDEVIVPANTFIATIMAISANGLTPVLVEPDARTYNLNFSLVERRITKRTGAIIVVHLYGRPCYDGGLNAFAYTHRLKVIEDNAQACGVKCYWGSRTGSLNSAAAFSFYPTKNLGALGDGGAVTTNNTALADMIRCLSNYGSEMKYKHVLKGVNSRLDELQAAFLNVKLKYVDRENAWRQSIASRYTTEICNDKIIPPHYDKDSVWHQYVIRTKLRDNLQIYLKNHGVETMIHYPTSPHRQEAYEEWCDLSLSVTDQLSQEVLSLPISPVMTMDEVSEVIKLVNKWRGLME
jgi:dTDP-4-amino-4,6-dideoxygalactose transaminase